MDAWLVPVMAGLGAIAGGAGALLGLGGGIFLVPLLVVVFHLPFPLVRGISLLTVIATSSAVAAGAASRPLMNVRLAMLLQVAASAGALGGGVTASHLSDRTLTLGFGVLMIGIALVMATRLQRRNISTDPSFDVGALGGRYFESESGREVAYRVRRLPLALAIAFLSGNVSSLLGLGGGILIVPGLNAWCGVPMRVAAATSALMIGITAVSAVPIFFARGDIDPPLAAAAVLGVLAGSRLGLHLGVRLGARTLKQAMIVVLVAVAATMLGRGLR